MPVPNTRIVVRGAPKADKEVTVVNSGREAAERLAQQHAQDAKVMELEIRRLVQGAFRGR